MKCIQVCLLSLLGDGEFAEYIHQFSRRLLGLKPLRNGLAFTNECPSLITSVGCIIACTVQPKAILFAVEKSETFFEKLEIRDYTFVLDGNLLMSF